MRMGTKDMSCNAVRDALFDLLGGEAPALSDEEIRLHLADCELCRRALPELAAKWVAINAAIAPKSVPPPSRELRERIKARAQEPEFPALQKKLIAYRDRFIRMAGAEAGTGKETLPILHRLEVGGGALEVICHTKEEFVLHLGIVDRISGQTSPSLDGGEFLFSSGRRIPIIQGGADIGLQEFSSELGFALVRPDGSILHVLEA